ncbi:MAG: hypothetical protein KatS3mg061_2647 [Dehalococcoidia bacterium]|nr:MAG: hypothetical protein KatS3mg061_2647 [Dehalococcoidia bacterium]
MGSPPKDRHMLCKAKYMEYLNQFPGACYAATRHPAAAGRVALVRRLGFACSRALTPRALDGEVQRRQFEGGKRMRRGSRSPFFRSLATLGVAAAILVGCAPQQPGTTTTGSSQQPSQPPAQ